MNYTIEDLCRTKPMFIRGKFPTYSQSRYFKIFNMLFKFGYHLTLCMKQGRYIPLTGELSGIRDLLYSYVNNRYKPGDIHYDILVHYKDNAILKKRETMLKDYILNHRISYFLKQRIEYQLHPQCMYNPDIYLLTLSPK